MFVVSALIPVVSILTLRCCHLKSLKSSFLFGTNIQFDQNTHLFRAAQPLHALDS